MLQGGDYPGHHSVYGGLTRWKRKWYALWRKANKDTLLPNIPTAGTESDRERGKSPEEERDIKK
jgi:hypothetical protein